MSEALTSVLFLISLIAGVYFLGRFLKALFVGNGDADVSFHSGDSRLRKLYAVAEKLNTATAVLARPSDLKKHRLFDRGLKLIAGEGVSNDDLLAYGSGANVSLSCLAYCALKGRTSDKAMRERVVRQLEGTGYWTLSFALDYLEDKAPSDEQLVVPVLAAMADDLWDNSSCNALADFIGRRMAGGETPDVENGLAGLDGYKLDQLRGFLQSQGDEMVRALAGRVPSAPDVAQAPDFLDSIGTVWGAEDAEAARSIVEHEALKTTVNRLVRELESNPPRSSLIVGEAGVGKTAVIERLASRLHRKGWTVFVAGHAELVAGQMYIGQFEERLRELTSFLKSNPKTLWVIPAFEALAFSGRHQYSPMSALDSLLPMIEQGAIKVVGEIGSSAYEQLALMQPRVVSAIGAHRLASLSREKTTDLARSWIKRRKARISDAVLNEASQMAHHFLSESAAPGNLMKLLDLTVGRLERNKPQEKQHDIELEDIIETLTELSGLPASILDDRQSLDLAELRSHFLGRVVGQDEAVACLVERVAMIKAGLTDPTRPSGVFLFAGPTGTGKTEIAKTLSEWLFGSANRLIRIDMSELQSQASLERLLGSDGGSGTTSLADHVRKQPFSVVLLDEFEKAHPNVWDVFLQVFDDGRLTDHRGRLVDFRHTIVILTSNLGATISTGTPMGFGSQPEGFDADNVLKAVEDTFRREFVNRIDRVVVFQPLSRDVMRQILRIEIDSAFRRRGLRSRSWAVEWDESAIGFLLDRGFRPDLGARPLKRALDQYLLAPLAVTIVNHQVPAGDQFLFITRKGDALDVEFVDPDAGEGGEAEDGAASDVSEGAYSLRGILADAKGTREEFEHILAVHQGIRDAVGGEAWQNERAANLAMLELPDFWQSEERFEILGLAEYMDRVEAAMRRTGSLLERLRNGARRNAFPTKMLTSAAQSLYLQQIAIEDVHGKRPPDAFLMIDAGHGDVDPDETTKAFGASITKMYVEWAKKRRMHLKPLGKSGTLFAVSGFGAHTILAGEAGLHVLESPGGRDGKQQRRTVRVRVAPQPPDASSPDAASPERLARVALDEHDKGRPKVVRRYRREPSPLVRDNARGWRTGRFDRVMEGDFDIIE